MAAKRPIGDIAQFYSALKDSLPGISLNPQVWGGKALELLSEMAKKGPLLKQTVSYLTEQDIKLYITREAKGVGAGWHETLSGEQWISIEKSCYFDRTMILIGHEGLQLQQPIRVRCSVEGEYHAWRLEYKLRAEVSGPGGSLSMTDNEKKLASMPENPSREELKEAQKLMHKIAGPNYLIHRAPLSGKTWTTAFLAFALKIINSVIKRGECI